MTAPDASDHDSATASTVGAGERATAIISSGEGQESASSPRSFLNRIGAPGLADIELDVSLPASPPRDVDFD